MERPLLQRAIPASSLSPLLVSPGLLMITNRRMYVPMAQPCLDWPCLACLLAPS